MYRSDIKEFRTPNQITGSDLVEIVKDYGLEGYDLYEYKQEHTGYVSGLTTATPYVYVLRFRRRLST